MRFELKTFNRNVPDEELLADLVRTHSLLEMAGKCLTFRTYREVGKFAPSTINTRFGTWNDALQRAGLPLHQEKNVSVEILFDNLRLVWIAKGRQPVYRDMSDLPSQHSGSAYAARFGGWRKALEEFVAVVGKEEHEQAHSVVSKEITIARTKRAPSLALRFLVLKRDRFRCVACGRSPATESGLVLEVDHISAWTNGGNTIAENLQSLCFDCNRGKSAT